MSAEQRAFFETKIRPVLVQHCYACHSADAKKIGGRLFLDTRDGILVGGESGPALIAGRPDESLLIQSLRYQDLEMPPKARLPAAIVNDFIEWVKLGAPDPRSKDAKDAQPAPNPAGSENESLWSTRPVANPPLPAVKAAASCRDPVDRFVLAQAEAAGVTPVADATPATLVRRLFYDLTGLPPTLAQVNAFVAECRSDSSFAIRHSAFEKLVDQPLAARVLDGSAADDDTARIRRAYEFALRREATALEIHRATALLRDVTADLQASAAAPDRSPVAAWAVFCQALLASNEFRYVD